MNAYKIPSGGAEARLYAKLKRRWKMAKSYMTKEEVVAYVAQKAGLKKADAYKAVNAFVEAVKDALGKGRGVRIIGFGTFQPQLWQGQDRKNPLTGKPIPPHYVPRFKPSKTLKEITKKIPVGK